MYNKCIQDAGAKVNEREIAMRKIFSVITSLRKRLLAPVGSLSKEFGVYDPVDKPIRRYESLLFWIAFYVSFLAKIMKDFIISKAYWTPFLMQILLCLPCAVILLSLFHLLVPPRLSASRLAFIMLATIMVLLLLSQN
jgi:hypothetical protein